jgi:hypothetical protein
MNFAHAGMKTLVCAGLAALPYLACAKDVAQAEWPQWRGVARDGLSPDTGNLKAWPAGGPALLWKATGLGTGYSSISISGGKIFSMGDAAESSMAFAYDLTGKQLWAAKIGKIGGNYPGTRCTPTVDGNVVYVLGQFGDIVCLQTADYRWRAVFVDRAGHDWRREAVRATHHGQRGRHLAAKRERAVESAAQGCHGSDSDTDHLQGSCVCYLRLRDWLQSLQNQQ